MTERLSPKPEGIRTPEDTLLTIDVILEAIDLCWDHIFDGSKKNNDKTLEISTPEMVHTNKPLREKTEVRRMHRYAYFLRCFRSELSLLTTNNQTVELLFPIETIEFRLVPELIESAKILITHIDPNGEPQSEEELPMSDLLTKDPVADEVLSRIEFNLLAFLVGRCIGLNPFDTLPRLVNEALIRAYGVKRGTELWKIGISAGRKQQKE